MITMYFWWCENNHRYRELRTEEETERYRDPPPKVPNCPVCGEPMEESR